MVSSIIETETKKGKGNDLGVSFLKFECKVLRLNQN